MRYRMLCGAGAFLAAALLTAGGPGRAPAAFAVIPPIPGLPIPETFFAPAARSAALASAIDAYYRGELTAAIAAYRQAIAGAREQAPLPRADLAAILKAAGLYEEALAEYRALAKASPQEAELWTQVGWLLYYLGRDGEAATAFESALALAPRSGPANFGLGLSFLAQEKWQEAIYPLSLCTSVDPSFSPAYSALGTAFDRLGRVVPAIAAYRTALRSDWSLIDLYLRLAQLYEGQEEYGLALTYYDGAIRVKPDDPVTKAAVDRFAALHPDVVAERRAEKEALRDHLPPQKVVPVANPQAIPLVRVGLIEGGGEIWFNVGGAFAIRSVPEQPGGAGAVLLQHPGHARVGVRLDGERLAVVGPNGAVLARAGGRIQIVPADRSTTAVFYDLVFDKGYFWTQTEDRTYRGSFEVVVRNKGLTLVNVVDVESYLLSNVPSEMPASWPAEALRAQAVAARTYTLYHLGQFSGRGFDILASTRSAAYRGVDWEAPETTAAVESTRGLVLTHGGTLVDAVYSSNNGGVSAPSAEIWGGEIPYLQTVSEAPERTALLPGPAAIEAWIKGIPSVPSSQSLYATRMNFRWLKVISRQAVEARLPTNARVGTIQRVIIIGRGPTGRVTEVRIIGDRGQYDMTGARAQTVFGGLKSLLFTIETRYGLAGRPLEFFVYGGGFGHAVGMSQQGASGLAEMGKSYPDILGFYYPGTTIRRRY